MLLGLLQGKKGNKVSANALMRMVSPSTGQQSGSGQARARSNPAVRQRITPTAVQSLERNARFEVPRGTLSSASVPLGQNRAGPVYLSDAENPAD